MRKRKRWGIWLATAAVIAFLAAGLDTRLICRGYQVESEQLTGRVRVVFLSDLHSCAYGESQRDLLELVAAQEPDLILLGGDWVDDDFGRHPPEVAYGTAEALTKMAPTFYVCGNHEVWCGYVEEIKGELAARGVTVLAGESKTLELPGGKVQIAGLDDPALGEALWWEQLQALEVAREPDTLHLLLTHRPERIEVYGGFDVALAGHAHGGQWRLPGLVNGLFAPDQGWFPRYAGGSYPMEGGGTLVVGRGLSRETTRIPRFYDRPEVVVVELIPTRG